MSAINLKLVLFIFISSLSWAQTLVATNPVRETSSFNYNAFPIMMKASNGTIVSLYRSAATHATTRGTIRMQTSTNNGASWTPFAGSGFGCQGGDPTDCLFADATFDSRPGAGGVANDGSLVFLWFKYNVSNGTTQGVFYSRSTDNGATWASPVAMAITGKTFGWTSNSEVVTVPGGAVSPTCPTGCLATVVWNVPQSTLYLVLSFDNGQTWTQANTITIPAGGTNEMALIWTGSDNIMGFDRGCQGTNSSAVCPLTIGSSSDMGATWTFANTNLTFTSPVPANVLAICRVNAPGHSCIGTAVGPAWELVSPWIVPSGLGDGSYTLFFTERADWDGDFTAYYLRATKFVPATAIASPTSMAYGSILNDGTTSGFVNSGYETVVPTTSLSSFLMQYYNENEPSTTNVFLFTLTAQYVFSSGISGGLKLSGGAVIK